MFTRWTIAGMLEQHAASGAGVTVGMRAGADRDASSFGVLRHRRARTRAELHREACAIHASAARLAARCSRSMGIYVFTTDYLVELLNRDARLTDSAHDFGRDILPDAVRENRVARALVRRRDRQPGLLARCRHARLVLADATWSCWRRTHRIDLYDSSWPIRTLAEALPPARLAGDCGRRGFVGNSMLAAGTVVGCATVTRSVLSTGVRVGDGSVLDEAVVLPNARIGANCRLRRVIIDSGTEVPDGTVDRLAGRPRRARHTSARHARHSRDRLRQPPRISARSLDSRRGARHRPARR